MTNNLFSEFPHTSSAEWLKQIEKDLRGKSPTDLYWSPDGKVTVNPFVHAEDVPETISVISTFGQWRIGEVFHVTDATSSQHSILTALQGGVESLHISCADNVDWGVLLSEVELPLIHLGIEIEGDAIAAIHRLLDYAKGKFDLKSLYITACSSNPDSLISIKDAFPQVRIGNVLQQSESVVEGIVDVIAHALDISNGSVEGLSQYDLSTTVGMHYLIEIARLRALRILWTNVSEALHFSISDAFAIEAYTRPCASDEDPHDHMIRSTIMGVASVLGGADRVYIAPAQGSGYPEPFYRHIARNIHHLLRYESKFTELPDPVAGAYYLEQLTQTITENAWARLLHVVKESGR